MCYPISTLYCQYIFSFFCDIFGAASGNSANRLAAGGIRLPILREKTIQEIKKRPIFYSGNDMKKILMITTSHNKLGDTGLQTGLWLGEFTSAYFVFTDAGFEVEVASPRGRVVPIDPASIIRGYAPPSCKRWFALNSQLLASSKKLSQIDPSQYDALFYPGGHGPMWDLRKNVHNKKIAEAFFADNRPVGAVCHGVAALLSARAASGEPVLAGRKLTGFSNAEEEIGGMKKIVPFLLEDEIKKCGANYSKSAPFCLHVVSDGSLITGQNQVSAKFAAKALLGVLAQKYAYA